jgi:hypothetical protein
MSRSTSGCWAGVGLGIEVGVAGSAVAVALGTSVALGMGVALGVDVALGTGVALGVFDGTRVLQPRHSKSNRRLTGAERRKRQVFTG